MARIDRIKEEVGYLKLHYSLLVAIYLSLLVWMIQNTSAYLGLIERLIAAFSWSNGLLPYFAIAPTFLLIAIILAIDLTIRRKIRELEDF